MPNLLIRIRVMDALIKKVLSWGFLALLLIATAANAKDLPGSAQTSYGVGNTGAFNFNIPIVVPEGTNGLQPNLSISFSSARGNGPLGVGWGVSGLGSVERCGKTFATNNKRVGVQHNNEDRFCLNGQQLILVSGSYGAAGSEYRTEINQFARIKAIGNGSADVNGGTSPTSWKVEYKDGRIAEYGTDTTGGYATARFVLPGTGSVHSWKLSRMLDRNGNYYEATYYTGQGSIREINYTGNTNSGLVTDKKVTFVYDETRSDVRTRYIAGHKITINDRLTRIDVTKDSTLVRQYNLGYELSSVSKLTRLTSVQECGLQNTCMPAIDIDWQAESKGFRNDANTKERAPHTGVDFNMPDVPDFAVGAFREVNYGTWADVNGDGLVDQVIAVKLLGASTPILKTFIKTSTGWSEPSQWRLPRPLRNYDAKAASGFTGFTPAAIEQGQLVDVNGDGLVDVVYGYVHHTNDDQNNNGAQVRETYLNTGNGWSSQPSTSYRPPDYIYSYVDNGNTSYVLTVRAQFVDLNGDGLPDFVSAYHKDYGVGTNASNYPNTIHRSTWINTGSGWSSPNSSYRLPDVFAHYKRERHTPNGTFVDLNGDGLLDWAHASSHLETSYTGLPTIASWLNTGTGWVPADDDYKLPSLLYRAPQLRIPVKRASMIDVNGDGLKDFVRSYSDDGDGTPIVGTWLNTGKGFVYKSSYNTPFAHIDPHDVVDQAPMYISGSYVDLNRDGLVDFAEVHRNENAAVTNRIWMNNGNTWVQDNSYAIDASTSNSNRTWLINDNFGHTSAKVTHGRFIDINNDGSPDWVKIRAGQSRISKISKVGKPDQLAKITTTMGVEIVPTFKPLTDNDTLYTKKPINSATGSALTAVADSRLIEAPIYVTSELQTSNADGSGNGYNSMEYRYGGAQSHRKGRGFLGFQRREIYDPQKDLTTITEFNQTFPYIGSPRRSVVEHDGSAISQTDNRYKLRSFATNSKIKLVFKDQVTSTTNELASNGGQRTRWTKQTITVDDYGNPLTQITQTGRNGNNLLNTTDVNNVYYQPNLTDWFVGQLDTSTTTFSGPNQTPIMRESKVTYDTLGRVATTIREPNGADNIKLTTAYTYDSYGNVATETLSSTEAGSQPRTNTIGYDPNQHRLPISLSNALNQSSTIAYHPQCDQPEFVTDINGQLTTYEYDNFCRQTKVISSANIESTIAYNTSNLSCLNCQTTPKLDITTQNQGEASVTTYYNLYSQAMLTETKGMLPTQDIEQRIDYDALGRKHRESQPYFIGDSEYWTSYTYDDLDRTTLTTLPYLDASGSLATVQTSYAVVTPALQRQTTINTLGNPKTTFANALGQIVEVKDAAQESMTYLYDAQGNLDKTTDAANNQIDVDYDVLGRRTDLNDPDLGLSSYTYNAFDEMLTQTDAKGQTITTGYDKLGRLISRTVPDNTTAPDPNNWTYVTSTFTFDTAANGVGSLASVTGPNGFSKTLGYDQYGRPDAEVTTIKGEIYTQAMTYNSDGFLDSRRYPDSGSNNNVFAVSYGYQNGYLATISGVDENNNTCIEHWRANEYDALGRTRQDTLGGIVTTTRTYDPGQGVLNKIESIMQVNGGATVQDLTYTYDANNNLKSRTDAFNTNNGTATTISETFDYDVLDRLTQHDDGSNIVTVTYNAIGNILSKSDVGTYTYGNNAGPHAVTHVASAPGTTDPLAKFDVDWEWNDETVDQTPDPQAQPQIHDVNYTYDANGNIRTQGNRSVTWTAFDKPKSMVLIGRDNTQRGSVMEYDAEFQRIFKQEGVFDAFGNLQTVKQTSVYIGKDYERITEANGDIKHRYIISAGGSTIQIEREDGSSFDKPSYMLGDNQGSTHVVLNAQGEVEQRLTFDPWGMRTQGADPTVVNKITNKGYTGHEMDDEVGLINMNARIYDPYLGRFLSADPVLPDAGDMQAFNRYAYVVNNPLKYTDPTGNMPNIDILCVHGGAGSSCGPGGRFDNGVDYGSGDLDSFPGNGKYDPLSYEDRLHIDTLIGMHDYYDHLQQAFGRYGEYADWSPTETIFRFASFITGISLDELAGQAEDSGFSIGFTFGFGGDDDNDVSIGVTVGGEEDYGGSRTPWVGRISVVTAGEIAGVGILNGVFSSSFTSREGVTTKTTVELEIKAAGLSFGLPAGVSFGNITLYDRFNFVSPQSLEGEAIFHTVGGGLGSILSGSATFIALGDASGYSIGYGGDLGAGAFFTVKGFSKITNVTTEVTGGF